MLDEIRVVPEIRMAEYPANGTRYPAGYQISKNAGYPVQP